MKKQTTIFILLVLIHLIPLSNANLILAQPSNNLVAYYPFDNDLRDYSGNNNHGLNQNTSFSNGFLGNTNTATQFRSDQQSYVTVPHHSSISLNQEMSIALWFFYTEQTTNGFITLLEKTNPDLEGHSRYGMWVYNRGIVEICVEPDNCPNGAPLCQRCLDASSNLELNQWHHLTGTFDGQSLKIYMDGQLNAERAFERSTGISQTEFELFMGTDPYDPFPTYLNGKLDEVRLYDKALTQEEIATLFPTTSNRNQVAYNNCLTFKTTFSQYESIELPNECNIRSIRLFSIEGKQLFFASPPSNSSINLQHLSLNPGIYFIQGKMKQNKYFTKKIIVQ